MATRTLPKFEERAGNILLVGGFITQDQLDDAKAASEAESTSLLDAMVSHGMVDQETLVTVLSVQLGISAVDLRYVDIDLEAVTLFPEKDARRHGVMPIGFEPDGSLRIATLMPDDSKLASRLSTLTGFPTTLVLAIGGNLEDLIDRVYTSIPVDAAAVVPADDAAPPEDEAPEDSAPPEEEAPQTVAQVEEKAPKAVPQPEEKAPEAIAQVEEKAPKAVPQPEEEAPDVVAPRNQNGSKATSVSNAGADAIFQNQDLSKLPAMQAVEMVTLQAVEASATNIHLVPNSDSAKILFRVNGQLQQAVELPSALHEDMVSIIKAEARMEISEGQRPQDGGFSLNIGERRVEFRVTSMATTWGDMMVIRVLDQYDGLLSLDSLGMETQSLQAWRSLLEAPYGMLMVSGPTGSGKTTTLYASLAELAVTRGNIMSVEDPIEYRINGVNQIQVNRAAGLDFASGLSSVLRLDPDVILVSEISDAETATAAMHAALSGHLVLASIQGSDAASSLVRLVDLGIEPVLAAIGVIGCLAQRLVRQVCPKCGVTTEATRTEAIAFAQEMDEVVTGFMSGQGCEFCDDSGFAGQSGVIEVLSVDETIRSQISEGASGAEVRETAIGNGMVAMRRAGLLMAQSGKTTMSEVLRKAFILG